MIEHKSIIAPAEGMQRNGMEVTLLTPDREGFVSAEAVRGALRPNTRLVSIEAANGEIGTIQPIEEIANLCRERGVLFHTDMTQAAGKIAIDFTIIAADMASLSAHKVYGPKGIGALYVRRGVRARPLVLGGGQERGLRSGTVNVPGAVGLSIALQLRSEEMYAEATRLTGIRNELWDRLVVEIPNVSVNGPRALRLPGNLNASFASIEADSLMVAMRRFSLSSGSACSSGERGPSRVLQALGVSEAMAMGSVRIGLGKSNTAEQMTMLVDDLRRVVAKLREISAA